MKNDYGLDWAKYQGNTGVYSNRPVKFVIAQVGGISEGQLYDQLTYNSQVSTILSKGQRAHTYIWYEVGGSVEVGKKVLDYFIPKIKTPKGSIVALDYESGASDNKSANTEAILYGMRRLKESGYTPMYYSYKPYTLENVDYQRINSEFPNSLWIASYGSNAVGGDPEYNYFPSMDGIGIWQFNSMGIAQGLDVNIDLTGITDSGYNGNSGNNNSNSNNSNSGITINYSPNKELLDMYLIYTLDTKRWYVSNGVSVRYIRTTRFLDSYRDKYVKLRLPVEQVYQKEIDNEFGTNATKI